MENRCAFVNVGAARPAAALGRTQFAGCALRTAPSVMQRTPARRNGAGTIQMNFIARFFRVLRANASKVVSGLEDPEKIINQTVAEMENDLVRVKQAYAEVYATTKRLDKQREQATNMSKEWYKRAQLALEKGDEGLAREALTMRKQYEEQSKNVSKQYEMMNTNVGRLNGSMRALETKISDARSQKDQYVARARTAATTQKVNEMLGNVGDNGAVAAFESMKKKVEEMEVQSEVSGELSSNKDQRLEDRFRALEAGGDVDDELAKMKKEIGQSKQKWALPSDPSIEGELERMRKEKGYN